MPEIYYFPNFVIYFDQLRGNVNYFLFSGEFQGDIAIPFIESNQNKKASLKLQEEIEKYKQEVLEGLQIEEEGLPDYLRKKAKQEQSGLNSANYNEPLDNTGLASRGKTEQILKGVSLLSRNDTKGENIQSKLNVTNNESNYQPQNVNKYSDLPNKIKTSATR